MNRLMLALLWMPLGLTAQSTHLSWHIQHAYHNPATGITHQYLQQQREDIPIYGNLWQRQIHPNGDTLYLHKEGQEKAPFTGQFLLSADEALQAAAQWTQSSIQPAAESEKYWVYHQQDFRPVWSVVWPMPQQPTVWRLHIDAETGQVLHARDLTVSCHFGPEHDGQEAPATLHGAAIYAPTVFDESYYHFPWPLESPDWGSPQLLTADEMVHPSASPLGWHDDDGTVGGAYNYTRGNNVYAYYASVIPPYPPAKPILRNSSGNYYSGNVPLANANQAYHFDQDVVSIEPTSYLESVITNLFVWNNRLHDMLYDYGFDEATGNFQNHNYSTTGLAQDNLLVEAQDGLKLNNAFFFCPRDGKRPRMQMYLWDSAFPDMIDSGFDNLVISHEYFHGVVFRMVGGAMNTDCMYNDEHGSEGYCDIFGVLMTLQDQNGNGQLDREIVGEGVRTIGTYLLDEGPLGPGLRLAPYATDWDINPYTYADMPNVSAPHGVGFVWGTMLWDVAWALMDAYGYAANPFVSANSTAGNIRMLKIMIESLRHLPCEPNFPEMRDAIIRANTLLYQGEGNGLLWSAFAQRGLGYSAGPSGQAAYDMPPIRYQLTASTLETTPGEWVDYELSLYNGSDDTLRAALLTDTLPAHLLVEDPGTGLVDGQIISWPIHTSIAPGDTVNQAFRLRVSHDAFPSGTLYANGLEAGVSEFTPIGNWTLANDVSLAYQGQRAWYTPAPTALDERWIELSVEVVDGANNYLSFQHDFALDTFAQGAQIDIFQNGGWEDAGDRLRLYPYNGDFDEVPLFGRPAFNGNSQGYQRSMIDLRDKTGTVNLRFRLITIADGLPDIGGYWKLDHFELLNVSGLRQKAAFNSAERYELHTSLADPGLMITGNNSPLPVAWINFSARPVTDAIQLDWRVIATEAHQGFWVERQHDREAIKSVSWIPSHAAAGEQSYTFLDENVQSGVTYHYRLRQKDNDGQETLSEWRSARLGESSEPSWQIWPMPAQDALHLAWVVRATQEPIRISVFDHLGRRIQTHLLSDSGRYTLDISALSVGLYYLQVDDNIQLSNYRFMKQ